MAILYFLSTALIFIFWPLSLFKANTLVNYVNYILPTISILSSYMLKRKGSSLYLLPLVAIGIFEPKLTLFAIIFIVISIFNTNKIAHKLSMLAIAIAVLLINLNNFKGQTVFKVDYEQQQKTIRDTQLYSSIFLARMFHNKARIPLQKFSENLFSLIDPNNYFFGFAPRQVVNNQNLTKFPFVAIIFFLYGIYKFSSMRQKDWVLICLVASVFSLSILSIFDRQDFILWLPVALITVHGLYKAKQKWRFSRTLLFVFITTSLIELTRILLNP